MTSRPATGDDDAPGHRAFRCRVLGAGARRRALGRALRVAAVVVFELLDLAPGRFDEGAAFLAVDTDLLLAFAGAEADFATGRCDLVPCRTD